MSVKHGGECPSEDVLVISGCEYSVLPVEQKGLRPHAKTLQTHSRFADSCVLTTGLSY